MQFVEDVGKLSPVRLCCGVGRECDLKVKCGNA